MTRSGEPARPARDTGHGHDGEVDEAPERLWESREVRWSAASGLLVGAGFVARWLGASDPLADGVFVTATLAGMRFFAREAITELAEERRVGIELLMTVAAVIAGLLGLWEEAAMLAFLYSIAEALEEFTVDRTRGAIRALMDLAPKRVGRLVPGGDEEDIDLAELSVGDRFLVRPGQAVATDGTVEDGRSAVNEAAVTGESVPVEKQPGDEVFAGTLNTSGALVVVATATVADNTLAKIVDLVTEAQERKGRGEQFMDRFSYRYSPAVLAAGALVAILGGVVSGEWATWLERAATVVVAAAPCALVISIPITYVAAIGNASRRGVLIKGGIYLEELARIRVVALDKTGTLTAGRPAVVAVHAVDGVAEADLLRIAATVEARSEHPLARAIVDHTSRLGIIPERVDRFEALVGAGAQVQLNGRSYAVGSRALAADRGMAPHTLERVVEQMQRDGQTAAVVLDQDNPLGVIGIADVIRPQAADAVRELHDLGIERLVMLTGDNRLAAQVIAAQVGIDDVNAELRPQDKSTAVAELARRHDHVGMVGDGVNDAPALAAASVGIAMGTAGSDVALETADVALMADDLTKLTDAVRIGRRTRRVVIQNIALGLAILAVLVPGAIVGVFTLPIAVLAHELSELAVITNGLRLARR
jgi:heavy metal translocating P-type ATPase